MLLCYLLPWDYGFNAARRPLALPSGLSALWQCKGPLGSIKPIIPREKVA